MHILKPLPGTLPMPGRPLADAIGNWPMNSLGNKIFDLSGNGNNGTLQNTTVWTDGSYGPALEFDRLNAYVSIPVISALPNWNTYTIVVYVNTTNSIHRMIAVSWGHGLTNTPYIILGKTFDNKLFFIHHDNAGAGPTITASGPTITDGKIHQLAIVRLAANSWIAYVDGVQIATDATNAGATTSNLTAIGVQIKGTPAYYWDDKIEMGSIYNRALTASEIALNNQDPFCMFPENIMPEFGIAA